jgi:protein phosphatase
MDTLGDTADLKIFTDLDLLAAKHFGPGAPRTHVQFGALSHVGKVRTNNEDHYGIVRRYRTREVLMTNLPADVLTPTREEAYTMAVADGMGGAAFGEVASMLALRTGWDLTANALCWPFLVNDHEVEKVMEQLIVYGKRIHQAVIDRSRQTPESAGMGSTITGVLLVGADAFIGHVGDSRAYLQRGGMIQRLTQDHTQAQALVDAGVFASVNEAPRFMRHVLVNCLGGYAKDVHVETHHLPLLHGDRLLLCTDGLSDMLTDAEISLILNLRLTPQEACQALIDEALDHGGKDNVTAVLAHIEVGV